MGGQTTREHSLHYLKVVQHGPARPVWIHPFWSKAFVSHSLAWLALIHVRMLGMGNHTKIFHVLPKI
jgi:hypothetical protein